MTCLVLNKLENLIVGGKTRNNKNSFSETTTWDNLILIQFSTININFNTTRVHLDPGDIVLVAESISVSGKISWPNTETAGY